MPLYPSEMFSQVDHLHIKYLPKHVQFIAFTGVPCLTIEDTEAFQGLTLLNELMMFNCGLERVATAEWFRDLRSLTQLDMNINNLTSLDSPSTPVQLPKLVWLKVGCNAIARVDPGFFASMRNLTHLVMCSNALTCLESDTLAALTQLQVLDVSHNQMERIHACAFSRLAKLEALYLNSNELTSFEPGVFDGLVSLQRLDVSYNELRDCLATQENMFRAMSLRLRTLILNSCKLRKVNRRLFATLSSLKKSLHD